MGLRGTVEIIVAPAEETDLEAIDIESTSDIKERLVSISEAYVGLSMADGNPRAEVSAARSKLRKTRLLIKKKHKEKMKVIMNNYREEKKKYEKELNDLVSIIKPQEDRLAKELAKKKKQKKLADELKKVEEAKKAEIQERLDGFISQFKSILSYYQPYTVEDYEEALKKFKSQLGTFGELEKEAQSTYAIYSEKINDKINQCIGDFDLELNHYGAEYSVEEFDYKLEKFGEKLGTGFFRKGEELARETYDCWVQELEEKKDWCSKHGYCDGQNLSKFTLLLGNFGTEYSIDQFEKVLSEFKSKLSTFDEYKGHAEYIHKQFCSILDKKKKEAKQGYCEFPQESRRKRMYYLEEIEDAKDEAIEDAKVIEVSVPPSPLTSNLMEHFDQVLRCLHRSEIIKDETVFSEIEKPIVEDFHTGLQKVLKEFFRNYLSRYDKD